jgi:hypothetical protein
MITSKFSIQNALSTVLACLLLSSVLLTGALRHTSMLASNSHRYSGCRHGYRCTLQSSYVESSMFVYKQEVRAESVHTVGSM